MGRQVTVTRRIQIDVSGKSARLLYDDAKDLLEATHLNDVMHVTYRGQNRQ